MPRVGVLQHYWCENAGTFGDALRDQGHEVVTVPLFDGGAVPHGRAFDAWLVMGGPMGVDDVADYPWLAEERELLAELIAMDRPVLGVCLGAQLIACVAGAAVRRQGPGEIGVYDVALTDDAQSDPLFEGLPDPMRVFQWHNDTFDLPHGGIALASSERYEHQALRIGRRVYGFQFHLECTPRIVSYLCRDFPDAISGSPLAGMKQADLNVALTEQNRLACVLIRRWSMLFG